MAKQFDQHSNPPSAKPPLAPRPAAAKALDAKEHTFTAGDEVKVGQHLCLVQSVNLAADGTTVTSLSLMTLDGKHGFDAPLDSVTLVKGAKQATADALPDGHPLKAISAKK